MSDVFPALRANSYRDTWCGQVLPDRVGSEVRVAGWVHRRRDHGGLVFIDLRDRTGLVQLVFNPDEAGDAFELAHKLRSEDVLTASGPVVKRSEETVNRELPTGAVEIRVTDAEVLSDADTPLVDRVAGMNLQEVELEPWEDVLDPAGGDIDVFLDCAREIADLLHSVIPRL